MASKKRISETLGLFMRGAEALRSVGCAVESVPSLREEQHRSAHTIVQKCLALIDERMSRLQALESGARSYEKLSDLNENWRVLAEIAGLVVDMETIVFHLQHPERSPLIVQGDEVVWLVPRYRRCRPYRDVLVMVALKRHSLPTRWRGLRKSAESYAASEEQAAEPAKQSPVPVLAAA